MNKVKTNTYKIGDTTYTFIKCSVCNCEMEFNTNGAITINLGNKQVNEEIPDMLFYKSGEHRKDCPWRKVK